MSSKREHAEITNNGRDGVSCGAQVVLYCLLPLAASETVLGEKRVAAGCGCAALRVSVPQKAAHPGPRDRQQVGTPPAKGRRTGQHFFSKLLPSLE